jgi:hypothetical protein
MALVVSGHQAHQCVTGIDLRLMEGDDFLCTPLLRDGPAVQELAQKWHSELRGSGWT